MRQEKKLYEFLIRFNEKTGLVKGSHIIYVENIINNENELIHTKLTPAEKVSVLKGDTTGHNLYEIINEITISLQETISNQQDKILELEQQLLDK